MSVSFLFLELGDGVDLIPPSSMKSPPLFLCSSRARPVYVCIILMNFLHHRDAAGFDFLLFLSAFFPSRLFPFQLGKFLSVFRRLDETPLPDKLYSSSFPPLGSNRRVFPVVAPHPLWSPLKISL